MKKLLKVELLKVELLKVGLKKGEMLNVCIVSFLVAM